MKDPATLEAAYNDAAGVTASFTRNLFARMNRDLGTALDLDAIEHVAWYNARRERIDIYARFTRPAMIELPEFGRRFHLAAGEMVLTEISRKFRAVRDRRRVGRAPRLRRRRDVRRTRIGVRPAPAAPPPRRRPVPPRAWSRSGGSTEARARTLELVGRSHEAQLTRQHSPLMSPIVWDLGHIANFEEQWVRRAHAAHERRDDDARRRDHLYDAVAHPRAIARRLPLLDRAACLRYLDDARRHTLDVLARGAFPDDDPLLAGGFMHAHAGAARSAAQRDDAADDPARRRSRLRAAAGDAIRAAPSLPVDESAETIVPAGSFVMGTDDRARLRQRAPAHTRCRPGAPDRRAPVTNGAFLRFIDDGGYRRRELWSEDGWPWLRESGVRTPGAVAAGRRRRVARAGVRPRGAPRPRPAGDPRLAGTKPTPTRAGRANACRPRSSGRRPPRGISSSAPRAAIRGATRRPARSAPTLDQRTFAPAAVGAYPRGASYFGCQQMLGDVWEWTASSFEPYPGFRAFPYPEYSAIHFGSGYKVLRGGSWATQPLVARNTFRNWDLPQRRQIFAGFRCARDA